MLKKWHINMTMITLLVVTLMSGCTSAQTPTIGRIGAPTPTNGVTGAQAPATSRTDQQTATVGDTVKVDYTGKLADGTVFDSSIGKTPLEFTIGSGQVIKGFDIAVLGMDVGQSKTVVISPEDAYGAHLDTLVVTVDKSRMGPGVNPTIGQQLKVTHSDGTTGTVVVTAVTDTTVTVDGNAPLAGKTLTFDITFVSITPKK